jgi:hypothetical protein
MTLMNNVSSSSQRCDRWWCADVSALEFICWPAIPGDVPTVAELHGLAPKLLQNYYKIQQAYHINYVAWPNLNSDCGRGPGI